MSAAVGDLRLGVERLCERKPNPRTSNVACATSAATSQPGSRVWSFHEASSSSASVVAHQLHASARTPHRSEKASTAANVGQHADMAFTVLLCADGSELAEQALADGLAVCRPPDRVVVATVIEPPIRCSPSARAWPAG